MKHDWRAYLGVSAAVHAAGIAYAVPRLSAVAGSSTAVEWTLVERAGPVRRASNHAHGRLRRTATASTPSAPVPAAPLSAPISAPLDAQALGFRPLYPHLSRVLGEEGDVTIHLERLPDGTVRRVEVVRTSGFARIDAAALAAVRTLPPAANLGGAAAQDIQFKFKLR